MSSPMEQVRLDLRRTPFDQTSQKRAAEWLAKLLEYGVSYYQGLHDVALNCQSYEQFEMLAFCVLRDFMTRDLDATMRVLALIPEILARADPEMSFLAPLPPHYAIAPIITLFSHTEPQVDDIFAHAGTGGLQSLVYFYCALVLVEKPNIRLRLKETEGDEFVHAILSQISLQGIERIKVFELAAELQRTIPLRSLPAYSHTSSFSALRGIVPLEKARKNYVQMLDPPSYVATYTIAMLALAVVVQVWMSE